MTSSRLSASDTSVYQQCLAEWKRTNMWLTWCELPTGNPYWMEDYQLAGSEERKPGHIALLTSAVRLSFQGSCLLWGLPNSRMWTLPGMSGLGAPIGACSLSRLQTNSWHCLLAQREWLMWWIIVNLIVTRVWWPRHPTPRIRDSYSSCCCSSEKSPVLWCLPCYGVGLCYGFSRCYDDSLCKPVLWYDGPDISNISVK